jgi:hypothetical protein
VIEKLFFSRSYPLIINERKNHLKNPPKLLKIPPQKKQKNRNKKPSIPAEKSKKKVKKK